MLVVSQKAHKPRVQYNPHGYKRARRRYEEGDPRALIRMMEEASVDSHVDGCLTGRRSGFKREWTLSPYDDEEKDQQRLDFFAGVLQRLHLRDLLEAIFDGRLYVWSVIDFEWEVRDGRQVPTDWKHFDWHHFRYASDAMDELRIDFGNELREIPETALVVESRKRPLMLPALRDWILKDFGLESFAAFIESFGEPFILGRYPAGMTDNEDFKNEVEQAVESIARSSRGIAPKGTDLDIVGTNQATTDHARFLEEAKNGISVSLLGHVNAVEDSGGINVGGRQSSYEVRRDVAVDDMYFLEPFINDFIQIIGDRNFGDGRYPRFQLDKSKPVDPQDLMDALDLAYRHGHELEGSDYRRLGINVDPDATVQKETGTVDDLMTE